MKARARMAGHAIHPMLMPFPLALLSTAAVLDLVNLVTDRAWLSEVTFVLVLAGVVTGPVAGLFGWIDWTRIPRGSRARGVATVHGVGNSLLVALFLIAWLLRLDQPAHAPTGFPIVLEVTGALLLAATGWLGGELVERLGVSVDERANVDAPNSLTTSDVPGDPYPAEPRSVTGSARPDLPTPPENPVRRG